MKTDHNFGQFGGTYVPETLVEPLQTLADCYAKLKKQNSFWSQITADLKTFVGRPTPLYHAKNWSTQLGGAQIYLKREDLNHTGAHKINNCVGQAYLAQHMKKNRIIAETGAGQHGVASATVCARMGMQCVVFMGAKDVKRQTQNVYRMQLLGAEVRPVESGDAGLKEALSEAMRYWVSHIDDTYYMIGTAAGPEPYPEIVRDFQSVIGKETKAQCLEQIGALPKVLVACVGGGSNAIGLFHSFLNDDVAMVGVEAGGVGDALGENAASLTRGSVGVLHGNKTYLLQDKHGQIAPTQSISAGLDYPGVGPEHAHLKDTGRVQYCCESDQHAVDAFFDLARLEGILPALESSHALAYAKKIAPTMSSSEVIVVNLSGRGDKDMATLHDFVK